MAEALILDAEAVNALARPATRGALRERARAILTLAHERRALVRVPVAVLAEICRGSRFDAPIDHLLKDRGIVVCDLTPPIARTAGHLLARLGLGSAHAIDSFVVATAATFDRSVIATGDPGDLRRLAATFRNVHVYAL